MLIYSDPDAAGLAPDRLARAYAYLEEVTRSGQVSGAALLIARHGQVVEPRAFGSPTLAGIGGRGPAMQPDNIFLVASVTKPVTVTAAMLLVERGLLYLDERVRDIIPEFGAGEQESDAENGKAQMRVRHLMTHTSGLPDMLPDNEKLRAEHAPLSEFVRRIYDVELSFMPDTDIQYQSCGLALLGEIVKGAQVSRCPSSCAPRFLNPWACKIPGWARRNLTNRALPRSM